MELSMRKLSITFWPNRGDLGLQLFLRRAHTHATIKHVEHMCTIKLRCFVSSPFLYLHLSRKAKVFPFFSRFFGRRLQSPHLHDRRRTRTFKATQLKRIPLSACGRFWVNGRALLYKTTARYCISIYLQKTHNILCIYSLSLYIVYLSSVSICLSINPGELEYFTNLTCLDIFLERFTSPKLSFGSI